MYDKAVNRKSNVHFSPRQTIEFLSNDVANAMLTEEIRRKIIKQYLDVRSWTLNKAGAGQLVL